MQVTTREVLNELGVKDALLDVALELERIALHDEYFIEKNSIPTSTSTRHHAQGDELPDHDVTCSSPSRATVGWIAQWKEMIEDPGSKIGRPRQLYTGEPQREYVR